MQTYNGEWFYPPRTDISFPFDGRLFQIWKNFPDAIAQYKLNGTNTQVKVNPDKTIELWTRHKDKTTKQPIRVKNYILPKSLKEEILRISPEGVYTVYNAELMHFKNKEIKNVLYFFDLLVWKDLHLTHQSYAYRHDLLKKINNWSILDLDNKNQNGKIFIADNISRVAWNISWEKIKKISWIEGLVLKRLGAVSNLRYGDKEINNSGFMARVRKPTKNFLY